MTKPDAYFIKCHLYKPGFAPKNVHFKVKFCYPIGASPGLDPWDSAALYFVGVASHSLKY